MFLFRENKAHPYQPLSWYRGEGNRRFYLWIILPRIYLLIVCPLSKNYRLAHSLVFIRWFYCPPCMAFLFEESTCPQIRATFRPVFVGSPLARARLVMLRRVREIKNRERILRAQLTDFMNIPGICLRFQQFYKFLYQIHWECQSFCAHPFTSFN